MSYIYPTIDEATRTAKIRLELHNPGYTLKPGMFVNVTLRDSGSGDGLLVPDGAVLRGGGTDIVFIDLGQGRYEPRTVKVGPRTGNGMYQISEGLKEGELVVGSGQFLLDSEANLRAAVRRLKPEAGALSAPSDNAAPSVAEYVCPMPEHMSITYKEPGKCPLCGMALVPAGPSSDLPLRIENYTCPMHPEVKESKPGRCPKCAMTLIPVYAHPADAVKPDHYECPMKEDNYSSPAPGKCPKCGMNLVPVLKK